MKKQIFLYTCLLILLCAGAIFAGYNNSDNTEKSGVIKEQCLKRLL